jgi:hypothetical protein
LTGSNELEAEVLRESKLLDVTVVVSEALALIDMAMLELTVFKTDGPELSAL